MKVLVFVFSLFISSGIFSQSGWQTIYPGNNLPGQYFKDIKFFDDQNGWILGQNNVTRTTNAGLNWSTYFIVHQFNQLTCFSFYNKDIGWVGENNYLNFTSNSGTNWSVINTSVSYPRGLYFRDLMTGWICGDSGMIKKTTNGGYNWVSMSSGTGVTLRAITFADNNTGICAGDWGTILSTTNGGANWTSFYDIYIGFYSHVKFKNSQTGFVSGTGGIIYRTTNSGVNWSPYFVNSFTVSGVHFTQNGTAYAFGSPGVIYRSTDSGNLWSQIAANGLFSTVNSVSITNDDDFWAAADSVVIYNSTDLGSNWNVIYREYLTREHINSVYFTSNLSGFACGERGVFFRSTNGGLNWLASNLGVNYALKDIRFVNSQTGFMAGGNINLTGIIFRTTNGGGSWQTVYNDSSQLSAIQFINPMTGWAAGSSGYYLSSTNGGLNWARSKFESTDIEDICFIDINTGFIGKGTGLYRTTNGGMNWTQSSSNQTGAIQFIGNTGYASTRTNNAYFLLKTTNSGISWQQYQIAGGLYKELYFANDQTGWIIAGNSIRKTTNGGVNWSIQTTGSNSIYGIKLHFIDENLGWCVGMYGGIMRTTTGGIGIQPINSTIPNGYELFQNYPNPFNPMTKLKFSIPLSVETTRRVVSLRIYDVLGKEIAVLVNENLKPGIYEIEWDASNIPSGVYFYSLITSEFTQTKKMVVLK